jgi:SPP1 family holin
MKGEQMNKFNLAGLDKMVIVRAILTLIFAFNMLASSFGWQLLPLTEDAVGEAVSGFIAVLTILVWLWGWWKNNSFTLNAQTADEILKELNAEG